MCCVNRSHRVPVVVCSDCMRQDLHWPTVDDLISGQVLIVDQFGSRTCQKCLCFLIGLIFNIINSTAYLDLWVAVWQPMHTLSTDAKTCLLKVQDGAWNMLMIMMMTQYILLLCIEPSFWNSLTLNLHTILLAWKAFPVYLKLLLFKTRLCFKPLKVAI